MSLKPAFLASLALLAAMTLMATAPAWAQEPQGPAVSRPAEAPHQKRGTTAPETGIRVKVQVVNAPVAVRDSKNRVILDLQKENFTILDNKVKQTIESFDLAGEPLSTVLVLETSSRVAPLLPAVRKSAVVFTQTVVGASGNAAVIGYDKEVQRLQPFTANQEDIERAITNLKAGDTTARLYDALSDAVGLLRAQPAGRRRVIIAVGESRDAGSSEKFGEVLRQAQLANVVIYSVGLSTTAAVARYDAQQAGPGSATPPGTFGMPPIPGTAQTPTSVEQHAGNVDVGALAELAVRNAASVVISEPLEVATAATGGMFQSTFRGRSIENALAAIGGDLNAQYTLTYEPTKSDQPGYHEIRIIVDRRGVKVRTRPGYYLEAQ
ncbi:MAG: VWA domain-containing protein [Acidobacteriia bacterium]|nr:VWA domain-containing protein [Terriglobia bacterium]